MTPAKRLLMLAEISQSEIARKIGVSRPLINQIINGNRKPYPKIMEEIERATGISQHLLFPGDMKELGEAGRRPWR